MSKLRLLLAAVVVLSGAFGMNAVRAETPCPEAACTIITGSAFDPHGRPAPSYSVSVRKQNGIIATTTTDAAGGFRFALPPTVPNDCYQVYGSADAFYSASSVPRKVCSSITVRLTPYYRIQGVSGLQKVYLGDTSKTITIPVEISALSRVYPAPFANDPLAYGFDHHHPADNTPEPGSDEGLAHRHASDEGHFAPPASRKIADGVWQYIWKQNVVLPEHTPGYYDMDWGIKSGDRSSVFSGMMDCRMVWFGYGLSSISPSTALPGQTVTITGLRLGNEQGKVIIKGSGQVTTISGTSIISWTTNTVKFVVPPGTKSGWVAAIPPQAVRTNAQPLSVGVPA
ncbi:MAG: hypothetical protein NVSMB57_08400 [Actinomycetota bacterium]